MVGTEELIVYAAIIGLLIGIVWSLRYLVLVDRKLETLDKKIMAAISRKRK